MPIKSVLCTWQASSRCLSLQGALLHALGHGERILRNTVGSAIAAVVAATGLVAWPELVPALTLCLSSVELSAVEGGLDALYQVKPLVLRLAQNPTLNPKPGRAEVSVSTAG